MIPVKFVPVELQALCILISQLGQYILHGKGPDLKALKANLLILKTHAN